MVACPVVLNVAAIEAAARDILGLKAKPWVIVDEHASWGSAAYWGMVFNRHKVAVKPFYASPGDISGIIFHELTHALQLERDFHGDYYRFFTEWEAQVRMAGPPKTISAFRRHDAPMVDSFNVEYRRAPFEAEAYANEKLGLRYPLVDFC